MSELENGGGGGGGDTVHVVGCVPVYEKEDCVFTAVKKIERPGDGVQKSIPCGLS